MPSIPHPYGLVGVGLLVGREFYIATEVTSWLAMELAPNRKLFPDHFPSLFFFETLLCIGDLQGPTISKYGELNNNKICRNVASLGDFFSENPL